MSNFLREKILKNRILFYFMLCFYLLINTGLVSDDFAEIYSHRGQDLFHFAANYEITIPLLKLSHGILYNLLSSDNAVLFDLAKVFYIWLSLLCINRFFLLFHNDNRAMLLSFILIFYPIHDSSTYFYLGQYLTVSIALYMYAYYLADKDRLLPAGAAALLASFICYNSTPFALCLVTLFLLRKELLKAVVLGIPHAIYILYNIFITMVLDTGTKKLPQGLKLLTVAKQFALQTLTFADTAVGPSLWLKVYYSFFELTPLSVVIGACAVVWFYFDSNGEQEPYDRKLLLSFSLMVLTAMMLISLTGYYPQIAFNLMNRVTIYSSILFTYIIVMLPLPRKASVVVFAVLIFSILGVSDHWKNWNRHQQTVINNIRNNKHLIEYNDDRMIFVSGNQYSKFGKISHIEFFSEAHVPQSILSLVLNKEIRVSPINRRFKFENSLLIDTKYDSKFRVNEYINVYDSDENVFFQLKPEEINAYIASMPYDLRHWVQLEQMDFARNIVLRLMPRLKYAM